MSKKQKWKQVGNIGNYYGGLHVLERDGKFYWVIENWDGEPNPDTDGEEIPEALYRELLKQKRTI